MAGKRVMILEEGAQLESGIRFRFISDYYKVSSYISSSQRLLYEIKINKPDVILLDLKIYDLIDGIKTTQMIRSEYNIPIVYIR